MRIKIPTIILILTVSLSVLFTAIPLIADTDDHYISTEHFFITKSKPAQGWVSMMIATMQTPEDPLKKDGAVFLVLSSGDEMKTKYYYKTRIAGKEEIRVGLEIIACMASDEEAYRAPQSEDEAIHSGWVMGKITDVSDIYKGYVKVSGETKVRIDNIRVVVKK